MGRIKFTLAYTGTAYAGWQIQAESQAKSTIQKELETVLGEIAGSPVRVHGAGRTDSGVHAEGQVAHADLPDKPVDWLRACNAKLPRDIRVLEAASVPASFHARHSATGKLYGYTLYSGNIPVPPRLEPFVWGTPALDRAAMEAAAAFLTGRRDFASFQNAGTPIDDTVRELWSIRCEPGLAGPFTCPPNWPVCTWFFHGSGFLKQMVRNLMGLLVSVGMGKSAPGDVAACLAAADRRALPSPTAPAKGLSLVHVEYPC